MSNALNPVYQANDGTLFPTRADALEHNRRPKIIEALLKLLGKDSMPVITWLVEQRDEIEAAFESQKIKRVTKSEKRQLAKALEAIKAAGDRNFAFISDNADAILETFRWPTVKRVDEAQQVLNIRAVLMALTGDNGDLTDWMMANREVLLEAFEAGKVKREVNEKASNALAAYREQRAAEKAAREEAKAAEDAKKAAETPEETVF